MASLHEDAPRAGTYRHLSRALDVSPEDCLVLDDDLPDMCTGAGPPALGTERNGLIHRWDHGANRGRLSSARARC
jgi:hypothetical protein